MSMETTAIIFRVDREGIIYALFPELPSDNYGYFCTCYQHIGQHCSADYRGCIANSRPATPAEYADLFSELEQRGYEMEVKQRATYAMHDKCRELAAV
jgi:hypothetical protein